MGTGCLSVVVEEIHDSKQLKMKNLIRIEEAAMFALTAYLSTYLSYPVWLYWALFLSPDIGMLGYVINPAIGSLSYNLFHHKAIAIIFYIVGVALGVELLQF